MTSDYPSAERIYAMDAAELSALYRNTIGYDPIAEGWAVEEVRETLLEYPAATTEGGEE